MIDPQFARFLEEGLGIHIATRDEHLEPNGARALAAKVEDDGLHLVVYLANTAAARLLDDLKSNGQAAISFVRPVDERACQVKGVFVSARAAKTAERPLVSAQFERFLDNLEQIGIPRQGAANWVRWPAVAVRVRATAVFNQTPGPGAGTPLV